MGKQQTIVSPFWKPVKKGEQIEGVILNFSPTTNQDGGQGLAVKVKDKKLGEKLIGVSYVVRKALEIYGAKNIRLGKTIIKVVFLEQGKTKNKRRVNRFDIEIDGKKIDIGTFKELNVQEAFAFMAKQDEK